MDVYQRLQKRLDLHPSGAPPSEDFTRILKIMFSPDEAEIACELTFDLQSLKKLITKTGIDEKRLFETLERLADRGSIIGIKMKEQAVYSLLPTVPGLFEYPFMRAQRYAEINELAALWNKYHDETLTDAFAGSPTPQMRVIAVQHSIPITSEVVIYDQVAEMIAKAKLFAVTDCACRVSRGNICGKPIEICLAFDNIARTLVERDRARWISKEECLDLLKIAEEEGLVHSISNIQDKLTLLCNCCSCCCSLLRGVKEHHNPNTVATSAYIVDLDENECIGCYICLDERCPMDVIYEKDDVVEIQTDRCIGCGLCVSVCPADALKMKRRDPAPPVPATTKELMTTILKEKGKLDDYNRINNEK